MSTDMSEDEAKKDLDETRRLLYMALLRQRTEKYELAATLVNALVHHQGVTLDVAEVIVHVLRVIEGGDDDGTSTMWMQNQIGHISDQLVD